MKAKVNKCIAVAIAGQTGRVYDPKLAMVGEPLPFLVDKAVKFLGLPITTRFDSEEIKSSLMSKLDNYLTHLCIYKETLIRYRTLSDAIAHTEQLSHCTQARPIQ